MINDFVKKATEMVWGETPLEMGFLKFLFTFVVIFVGIKAFMYFIEGDKK